METSEQFQYEGMRSGQRQRSASPQQNLHIMPNAQQTQIPQPQGSPCPPMSSSDEEEEVLSDIDDDFFFDDNSDEEDTRNMEAGNAENHGETRSNLDLKRNVDQVNERIQSTVATNSSTNFIKMLVSK
jgi:hypothetical protein